MNHEIYNEEIIRSFLLGRLPAAEEDAFEIRLLGDADLQTALEAAEYDLIDDLQMDGASEWAGEARRKLAELEDLKKKAVRNNDQLWQDFLAAYEVNDEARIWEAFGLSRERMGNAITERLLDEYLQLLDQGRGDDANRGLAMLARAGELEASQVGDFYTRDLAVFYQRASTAQRQLLAKGRELFKTGREKNRTSWTEAGE